MNGDFTDISLLGFAGLGRGGSWLPLCACVCAWVCVCVSVCVCVRGCVCVSVCLRVLSCVVVFLCLVLSCFLFFPFLFLSLVLVAPHALQRPGAAMR